MSEHISSLAHRLRRITEPNAETLAQSIDLEETDPPHVFTVLIYLCCGLIAFSIFWAGATKVDEVTRAQGVVKPAGDVVAIQHLEGGLVSAIEIVEGEMVEPGQTLLRLAPLDTEAQVNQVRVRRANLLLSIERSRAMADDDAPDFAGVLPGFDDLKQEQQALYEAQIAAYEDNLGVLESQSQQKHAEIVRLENQLAALERNAEVVDKEYELRKKLFDDGLTTRDRLYAVQREKQQSDQRVVDTRDILMRTINEGLEAQERIEELKSSTRSTAKQEETDLKAELAEVAETYKSLLARSERLSVTAPVAGIIKGMNVKSVNSVVRGGDIIMEIVPIADRMVVAARVAPHEIGHIKPGQQADVRVATYDFSTYGSLNGTVELISASTFQDERGEAYYEALVGVDRAYFGPDPSRFRILPGMSVEADIKTGSKSILTYMLKPVNRAWNNAFRER